MTTFIFNSVIPGVNLKHLYISSNDLYLSIIQLCFYSHKVVWNNKIINTPFITLISGGYSETVYIPLNYNVHFNNSNVSLIGMISV